MNTFDIKVKKKKKKKKKKRRRKKEKEKRESIIDPSINFLTNMSNRKKACQYFK